MNNPRFLTIPVTLILVSLGCGLRSTPSPMPGSVTPTSPAVVTKSIPTDTLVPTTPPEAFKPTSTKPAEPTTSAFTPPHLMPQGFITVNENDTSLTFFDVDGKPITEMRAPGLFGSSPRFVHVAGRLSNGVNQIPLIYYSTEHDGSIQMNINEDITTLVINPNITLLLGAPGLTITTYTTHEWRGNTLVSELYLGDIQTLPTAEPIMVRSDPESWAIRPLALHIDGDTPMGVWYTLTPWGIGGDIVFEPRRSLYYLDLSTGDENEYLEPFANPSSFAPDLSWFAYTEGQEAAPLIIVPEQDKQLSITFPLGPESNRGAGNAVFSPDNQYVAWMEGSGYRMAEQPDFHITIRIASTSGKIVTEFPEGALAGAIGTQYIQWVEPVGWLDGHTLLIQVQFDTWSQSAIVSLDLDGNDPSYLAPGMFAGFLYP